MTSIANLKNAVNFGVCGYLSDLPEEKIIALDAIVGHWIKNKKIFLSKAQCHYPFGNGLGCLDPTIEYSMPLSGHGLNLTLRISNPDSVVYSRSERWYL